MRHNKYPVRLQWSVIIWSVANSNCNKSSITHYHITHIISLSLKYHSLSYMNLIYYKCCYISRQLFAQVHIHMCSVSTNKSLNYRHPTTRKFVSIVRRLSHETQTERWVCSSDVYCLLKRNNKQTVIILLFSLSRYFLSSIVHLVILNEPVGFENLPTQHYVYNI